MIKKAKIEDKLYDVVTFDEYVGTRDGLLHNTAIEDNGVLYPYRNKTEVVENAPGFYDYGAAIQFVNGDKNNPNYGTKNLIDFDNAKDLKDIIEKQNQLRNMEKEILTSPDNIFKPNITEGDTPEMKGIKEAVICKNIDLDKYQYRFGSNYCNDRRLFVKKDITLTMMKRVFNALDMKGTLIIEDKNDDVPNPIGKKIIVDLTEGDD